MVNRKSDEGGRFVRHVRSGIPIRTAEEAAQKVAVAELPHSHSPIPCRRRIGEFALNGGADVDAPLGVEVEPSLVDNVTALYSGATLLRARKPALVFVDSWHDCWIRRPSVPESSSN